MTHTADNARAPLVYTLFPRLAGTMPEWLSHSARARDLGFRWIHLNPIHLTGASGSLYAVKDFYQVDPDFIPAGCADGLKELGRTLEAMHEQGLFVMMDLVVNHVARDSPLVQDRARWFRRDHSGNVISPSAVDPDDPNKVTVWTDLAEADNAHSPDRAELWRYWTELVQYYLDLGFDGFRCDAAYKVPAPLWEQLIRAGRRHNPGVVFAAETLGCRPTEVRALRAAGFDYLFNSSKWWDFDKSWCLEQHEEFRHIAPSISFPETHDTERLMHQTGGRAQVQKQRYAFAAAFAAGILMPIGYEYGARKPLHVVKSRPADWEEHVNLTRFIREVNRWSLELPIMREEGQWAVLTDLDSPTTVLRKRAEGFEPLVLLINKDWHQHQRVQLPDLPRRFPRGAQMIRICRDQATPEALPGGHELELDPAEVVYLVSSHS
jgi:starch synthase (maltosyl-transferring)